MLIEFSASNFRSLRERQTLSLVKATGDERAEANTFNIYAASDYQLLRSVAIYGPNAGGKSNFLHALKTMKRMVLKSAIRQQRGDKLSVVPFRLSQASLNAPSEFEATFIVGQVRYQYGFSATADRIHEEWLLAYPKGRPQHWYDRVWHEQTQNYEWTLGHYLTGEKQLWQKSTRDNALFLSTAVQLNSEQLQPIYDWFDKTLRLDGGWNPNRSVSLCETSEKEQVINFLRAADLNIEDIVIEKKPVDVKMLPDDMPPNIKDLILHDLTNLQTINVQTMHKSMDGKEVFFDFEDESEGTQKLFELAGPWIDSLTKGHVLFIDELNEHLHPHLVKFLVQLFHGNETNPKNAQLVFTTHETSILNQEVFRRDQIWFCEKDSQQATVLYPLTDFSPRKGRENLELSYLSGRYGALPYVGTIGTPTIKQAKD